MTRARTRWLGAALPPAVGTIVMIALAWEFLAGVLGSTVPSGWDGVGHYAAADLYARHVFPAIDGWLPEFFAGMPFPDYYPPLFYVVVGSLSKLGLTTAQAYWLVTLVASAAVPALTYACAARATGDRVAAVTAGVAAGVLMAGAGPTATFGIGLRATFDVGLAPQLLGFVLVLALLAVLLDRRRLRSRLLAAVLLGAAPLTNVHTLWYAVVLFAGVAIAELAVAGERRRVALEYAQMGGIGLALSGCWVVPMLAHLGYVPTMASPMPPTAGQLSSALAAPIALTVLAAIAAFRGREPRVAGIAGGALALLGLAASSSLLPSLPLQPDRLVVGFVFLSPLAAAAVVAAVRRIAGVGAARAGAVAAIGLIVLTWLAPIQRLRIPTGVVEPEMQSAYDGVLAALDGERGGRVLVEMAAPPIVDSFALEAEVGRRGMRSVTAVFREASLSSLFAYPVRDSISAQRESYGLDSKIAPARLRDSDPATTLARLQLFNVRHVLVKSALGHRRVSSLPGARRLATSGDWTAYAVPAGDGDAIVPRFEPALVFARFTVKPRPDRGVDFVRLNEELVERGQLDAPLALSPTGAIDAEDLSRFAVVVVADYRYRDRAEAFAALERVSRDRVVIAVASEDPLFAALAELARDRSTVRLVAGTPSAVADAIGAARVPVVPAPSIARVELGRDRTTVAFDVAPTRPVPVWIKQSYHPLWRRADGAPVYLATPSFVLTFATERELVLERRRGGWHALGWLLSALGVTALGFAAWRRARTARGS